MLLSIVEPGIPLYVAPLGLPNQVARLYFVPASAPTPLPDTIEFDTTWKAAAWAGWYVFLNEALTGAQAQDFVNTVQNNLPPIAAPSDVRGIFWATYTPAWSVLTGFLCSGPGPHKAVPTMQTLEFSGFAFALVAGTAITYVPAVRQRNPDQITISRQGTEIAFEGEIQTAQIVTDIPIALQDMGPTPANPLNVLAGTLSVDAVLDFGRMAFYFNCCFTYFIGGITVQSLVYPFLPIPQGKSPVPFVIQIHPFFLTDPNRTYFALNVKGMQPQWQSVNFSNILGNALTLSPVVQDSLPRAGFTFAQAPAGHLYLTPCGPWQMSGSGALMPGLSAQEYLTIQYPAAVNLVPNCPAFLPAGSGSGSPAGGGLPLDGTYTTSWVQIPQGTVGYFGQPSTSVYYTPAGGQEYPLAVNARLSAAIPNDVAFPVVPYLGVQGTGPMQVFESNALSTMRHALLVAADEAPIFLPPSSLGARTAVSEPSDALTPQGFVAHLNPDGTWNELVLAVDPSGNQVTIAGDSSPSQVPSALASTLLQNDVFLVVSQAGALGKFQNSILVEDFTFVMDVPQGAVLVFKFNPNASLVDLLQQSSLWASPETFVGSPAQQQQIAQMLESAIAEARQGGNAFANFNTIVESPSWTGVLAFNCEVDGESLPASLKLLMGGITGTLRAHHFGIQSSRVEPGTPPRLDLVESSLFGVIHYDDPDTSPSRAQGSPPAFDYNVLNLTVVFSNSKITEFHSTVGLTVNEAFGREVELVPVGSPPPLPNTLVITGQFQQQGNVPSVSFVSQTPTEFRFVKPENTSRVLEKIVFTHASLTPVQDAGSPSSQMQANFALSGELWFSRNPFGGTDIDLFSYGNPVGANASGAAFSGFNVALTFDLDKHGHATSKTVKQTGVPQLAPTSDCVRAGSLLSNLPLRFTRLNYSADGLTPSATGAYPVHCLDLEGSKSHAIASPTSPPMPNPPQSPYVTASPTYALEFDMPLGSLGALSDVHVGLMAKLLIGWGPSALVPGDDAAAVMVQLPSLTAGYKGFNLQGLLGLKFGDANLLRVHVKSQSGPVYAVLFNNVQLSVFGFGFPPGLIVDFLLFAGPASSGPTNTNNIAWFLGAYQQGSPS